MNLKNYTTQVNAVKSINMIEKLLVDFGSKNIMKEYGPEGRVSAISFTLDTQGMVLPFRLPAKVQEAYLWLKRKHNSSNAKTLMDQAERIVWKQLYEWVFLQLCMIELEQAEKLELFFPYLKDVQKNETFYQKLKSNGFKQLSNG